MRRAALLALLAAVLLPACVRRLPAAAGGGVGSRVFVVERASASLAVYDVAVRRVVGRIEGLGNLEHATMTFSPDLRWGYVASRGGQLSRVDLERLERAGELRAAESSIDLAISQDGRWVATADYLPGGVTILDADTLAVKKRIRAMGEENERTFPSRVTGIVDAPGNRFVCVLMEGAQVWIIDAASPDFPITHRIPLTGGEPYDAMITPDGRTYVVGHRGAPTVSVIDLTDPKPGARVVSLEEPGRTWARGVPVKVPHLASWAVARGRVFVPLVGEKRLAVLDRDTWAFARSIPLRGHPVYAVRAPGEREVWVSFSGPEDDAFVQVIDTETLAVTRTLRVGGRIYHMEFTPRGGHLLATANRDEKLVVVNAGTYAIETEVPLRSPSGVFGVWRAFTSGL